MPQSETTSPEDGGGLCCCLGSSRDKAHDQPVTLIKSEPITSQPNSQSMASPQEAPMNGIRTKTAEKSIDGFEEVSLEMKTIQQALPTSKPTKDHFNITDMHMDALCTEEEIGEEIVEDEPDISANVIEEVDEVELKSLAHKGFPSVTRDDTKSGEISDEELTFKQMMAEDYERRKKELLKEIESAEEQEREAEEENNSNRSFLNLELESDKASNQGKTLASPSGHQEIQKTEDRPSTSREDSDREDPPEEMRRKPSVEEKRDIERSRVEQQLMNEIETLDLDEVTDEEHKWEQKRQLSERELKKADDQFREVVPQLSARSGDETDVEESDDEDDEEEIMVDRHTETLPIHRVAASQMYSKMSESDDESDDEEEREVIVPPPRRAHQKNTVASSDEDSGKGNTRPDSSSEKENLAQTEAQSGANDNHVTRVSLKSNGTSTVVVDGESGGVRVSLDHPHPTRSLETQFTDEEFSEKLI